MFWLIWKHMGIKLRKVTVWDKSWTQRPVVRDGAEWPEDTLLGTLADGKRVSVV